MPQGRFYDGLTTKPHAVDVFIDSQGQVCVAELGTSNILFKVWPSDIDLGEDGVSRKGFSFRNRKGLIEFQDERTMQRLFNSAPQRTISLTRSRLSPVVIIVGALLAIVGGYFLIVPAVVDISVSMISREQERKIFAAPVEALKGNWQVDKSKTKAARSFFKAMNVPSVGQIDVYIIKDPDLVNAFAMPGGTMVITTAMLDKIKTPEQLAALIGHEYGHIYHRHGMKMLARSLGLGMAFSLVFGDASGLIALFGSAAEDLLTKTYSRDFERESDEMSIELLKANKLSINGVAELFEILKEVSGETTAESKAANYFSTHPILDERIEAGKQAANAQTSSARPNKELQSAFELLKNE